MSRVYNTGETDESLKSEYNPEGSDLRRAQLRMLEMLVFLDRICKENNLEYILGDGTLLGAVRHGGYIPWDDDLDVYMPAGDINRLAKIVNSGDYDFVVQTHQSDKGFVRQCAVLRDLKSEYIKSEFVHNQRKYRGLQIDLFQYGFGVNGSLKHLIHKITWKNENMYLGKNKFMSSFAYGVCRYFLIPVFKFFSLFRGKKTVSEGYETCWWHHEIPSDYVFPLKTIQFEGKDFAGPNKPEEVCEILYGNYTDLPPRDARDHHSVEQIVYYDERKTVS